MRLNPAIVGHSRDHGLLAQDLFNAPAVSSVRASDAAGAATETLTREQVTVVFPRDEACRKSLTSKIVAGAE